MCKSCRAGRVRLKLAGKILAAMAPASVAANPDKVGPNFMLPPAAQVAAVAVELADALLSRLKETEKP